MAFLRSLVACTCWLLLFPAVCSKITYPSSLVRTIGEDVVFKWNSTDPIIQAHWGTMYNNSDKIEFHIIDKYLDKPADIHVDMNKFIYKNRIMFVGNLTDGHAWFKLTNLTIADTNYFGAYIISGPLGGQRPKVYSTYLKVQVVRFIQVPPNIQYVAKGQTATFSWDYFPVKKSIKLLSRIWQVYNSVNGWKTIGAEHSISGWQWKLSASCPARLKNPTRVSKASTASLVIYDVTIEDSGLYRCNLHLRGRPPVTSTTQLIVTVVGPQFTSQPPPSKYIAEGQPNPNQRPVTAQTSIDVMSDKPSIDYTTSDTTVTSETSDDHNEQPRMTIACDYGRDPVFIACIVSIVVLVVVVVILGGCAIKRCRSARKTKGRSDSVEMIETKRNNSYVRAVANSVPATSITDSIATLRARFMNNDARRPQI